MLVPAYFFNLEGPSGQAARPESNANLRLSVAKALS